MIAFRPRAGLALLAAALLGSVTPAFAGAREVVDPDAVALLKTMSATLSQADSIIVTARVQSEHLASDGQMLESYGTAQAVLLRPNRFYTASQSDLQNYATWYDGVVLTTYRPLENTYVQMPGKGDNDAMIGVVEQRLDLPLPLASLLLSDPYGAISAGMQSITVVGRTQIGDALCEHLALRGAQVDWQLWITIDDAHPLPARMTVMYKEEPGAPRLAIEFLRWDLNQPLPASKFRFTAPAGATAASGRL